MDNDLEVPKATLENGGITGGDCGHGEALAGLKILVMARERCIGCRPRWRSSPVPKLARTVAVAMENGEQSCLAGGQCSGASVGARPRLVLEVRGT